MPTMIYEDYEDVANAEMELVGFDTSTDGYTLTAVCVDCGSPSDGPFIYAGDLWGEHTLRCSECGTNIPITPAIGYHA